MKIVTAILHRLHDQKAIGLVLLVFAFALCTGCDELIPPPPDERHRPRPTIDDNLEIDERNNRPIPGPVEGYR